MLDDSIKHKMNDLNLNGGNIFFLQSKDYEYSGEDEVEYEI